MDPADPEAAPEEEKSTRRSSRHAKAEPPPKPPPTKAELANERLDLKLRKEYAETREEVRTCPKCEVMVVIEDVKQNPKLLDSLTCINNNCKHKFVSCCNASNA